MAVTELETRRDRRRWAALTLLCVASFMMILDAQIVILALPSLQNDLALPTEQVQWVLTANAIAFGGLLLLGGRAADLLGRRLVFMLGVTGFLITSLVSGIAWSGAVLIAARALHGFSSAVMVPSALSILMNTFPEGRERNKAIAAWSAVGGIGAVTGLLIGGVLTTAFGWQWVFLVNVPVVLVVLVAAPFVLKESKGENRVRTFDLAGAVTSTGALVALTYALVDAPASGWTSASTIGLFAATAVLTALFVVIERRSSAPLVPLQLLRKRTVGIGNVLVLVVAMFAWGESLLISLHTQQVLGYSAIEAGLAGAIMPVMAVAGAYIGQAIVTRRGFRAAAAPAAVAFGVACLFLVRLPVQANYVVDIFLPLVLFGLALGVGHTTATVASLTGVGERDSGLASGLTSAGGQIGGAFCAAVITTVVVSVTAGSTAPAALASGYHAGFVALVVIAVVMFATAFLLPRGERKTTSRPADAPPATELDRAA
jgi:EmrB/QacA subfamily drug resistance transporter